MELGEVRLTSISPQLMAIKQLVKVKSLYHFDIILLDLTMLGFILNKEFQNGKSCFCLL